MNDFTKEELQILWLELPVIHYLELKNKIQSMIDNYCEHEHLNFVGDVNGYYCKKCDKQFDYEYVGDERHERIINEQDL